MNESIFLLLTLLTSLASVQVSALPPQNIIIPPEFVHFFEPGRSPCPGSSQVTVRQKRADVTSFCMQFKKIGCWLLREASGVRGSALLAKREGENKKIQS